MSDQSSDLPAERPSVPASVYEPPTDKALIASAPSFFIPPPFGWRHPATQRAGWLPRFPLIAFGMYVKRARYLANMTQRELARQSGLDQGVISRLERALAPWMKVEHVVKLSGVLGQMLPLGYCPHHHPCAWQPAPMPQDEWEGVWMPDELRRIFAAEADDAAEEARADAMRRGRS